MCYEMCYRAHVIWCVCRANNSWSQLITHAQYNGRSECADAPASVTFKFPAVCARFASETKKSIDFFGRPGLSQVSVIGLHSWAAAGTLHLRFLLKKVTGVFMMKGPCFTRLEERKFDFRPPEESFRFNFIIDSLSFSFDKNKTIKP